MNDGRPDSPPVEFRCEYRFAIALTFPGEHRDFVRQVDKHLIQQMASEHVFYDGRFEAELARPNLDTYLQSIYHDASELIIVFLCKEYDTKEWCKLEWRAVRDILKKRRDNDIMFVRFDDVDVPGIFSIDGYIDARAKSPKEIANLIYERLKAHRTMRDKTLLST